MILLLSHSPSVEAFFVREPSQAMRAADREPAGGEIPVELTSRQPFDDFPQQSGVSRTNSVHYISDRQHGDGQSPAMIIRDSEWIGGQMCFARYLGSSWVFGCKGKSHKGEVSL